MTDAAPPTLQPRAPAIGPRRGRFGQGTGEIERSQSPSGKAKRRTGALALSA
jgi:hypothetical protein